MNPTHPMPSNIELADLYRYADLIPGMCEDEKFHVLLEIACHSVKGGGSRLSSWRDWHSISRSGIFCASPRGVMRISCRTRRSGIVALYRWMRIRL